MYKLLIVDDEQGIRQGIANSIPWINWGFEIIGLACNGIEALEFIQKNKPHVILSDIRMPKMDGVELMQYLNQHYPEIKIIILSGYSDFEYLNMSIKNDVTEYLLKPTDIDEFKIVFLKIKEKLDQELSQEKEYKDLKANYEQNKEYHYTRMLSLLIKGYANEEMEFVEKDLLRELKINFKECIVVLFELDDRSTYNPRQLYALKTKIVELCNEGIYWQGYSVLGRLFLSFDEEVVGVFGTDNETNLEKKVLLKFIHRVQDLIQESFAATVSVGIGNICKDIRMLPQSYEQALCCVHQKMFLGSNSISLYAQIQEEGFPYYSITFNQENITKYIISNEKKKLQVELEQVFSRFENKVLKEYEYIDRMCLEFLFNLSRWSLKFNIRLEQVMQGIQCTYTDIYNRGSLKHKKDFLYQILDILSEEVEKHQSNHKNRLSSIIKEYVDQEYMLNRMSLEYVSKKVRKNTAYISKIFKNEIGYNFSDYVVKKRLEKSKELLEDPTLKIYEITEMIGYADVSNFVKLFKKNYGTSPSEYRNMIGRKH